MMNNNGNEEKKTITIFSILSLFGNPKMRRKKSRSREKSAWVGLGCAGLTVVFVEGGKISEKDNI